MQPSSQQPSYHSLSDPTTKHSHKPLKIDETFVGRSIGISWLRKFDHDNGDGFYVFDVGIISNVHHNTVQFGFKVMKKVIKWFST